jgi:TonB-linked SusC/RagA family outer membrane protein
MKKNKHLPYLPKGRDLLKMLLLMKLTMVFILFACMQVSARVYSQSKITLKLQSTELKKALSIIERKSSFRFLYNDETVPTHIKVDIDATNTPVTEILDKLLAGKALAYKILDNNLVVITGKNVEVLQTVITGRVVSSTGEPLQGVSVKIKGSSLGTQTDASGNFSITAPDDATLVISYVGYASQEIAVKGRTNISISLEASTQKMDEVVVIGYGTASKRDLTGSIFKVAGKEVSDKPNANPVASLQGKVAGVYIVNSGTPGAQPDIRIRGTTSIGQVHPLYIVDGIFQDNIDYLNPNDVESMEILKDPSSLAIFGVKGATGAIAITTKKAKAGQTSINFNITQGWKSLVDAPKFADAATFKTLYAEELANTGIATAPNYTGLTSNTDWIKALTRTANFQTANLSVSTSSERNKFNLGIGYTNDQGVVNHIQLDKLNINIGDEFKVNKNIKLGTNFIVSRIHNPYGYDGNDILSDARKVVPVLSSNPTTMQLTDLYGSSVINQKVYPLAPSLQLAGVVNPLLKLENEWNKTIDYTYRYVGNAFLEINFLKYLSFRSTVYGDISNEDSRKYTPTYYAFNPVSGAVQVQNPTTSVQDNTTTIKQFQQDEILTFKRKIKQHSITAIGGFTTRYFGSFGVNSTAYQGTFGPIPNDKRFWYVTSGFENPATTRATSNQYESATVSYLGRVLYNFADKYYLTLSYRDDGSSQISGAHRYQSFWAVGGGWELTKEKFMENQKLFDYIKIKGSIGVLGNQSAYDPNTGQANPYLFYPVLATGSVTPFGNNLFSAAAAAFKPDPNLQWETVHAQEVGVEANAFNNRLHFEFNYFNKSTEQLMTVINNSALGIQGQVTNAGTLRNWGEELSATWTQKMDKDFTLRLNGNITFLNNQVVALSPLLAGGRISRNSQNNGQQASYSDPGNPIGYFYGYQVAGLYQSNLDVLSSPNASSIGTYKAGDFKFKDISGPNGKVDGIIDPNDRTKIGNPSPKFIYGGSISLSYKRFDLGIDVGGVYGNQVFRTWAALESPYAFVNYAAFQSSRWHGAGTSNWVPQINSGERYNYQGSTYSIEDGSYFRIRNFQIAYNFNVNTLSKAHIKACRFFVNIQNIKTWKNNSSYSPEFGGDATSFGVDFGNSSSALPRIISAGLNVTF